MSKQHPSMNIELLLNESPNSEELRMLRTVIIEDNSAERENVLSFLAQLCPNVEVVGVASEVNEAVRVVVETNPDLLLTDVQITGGSCYQLLEQLRHKNQLDSLSIIFMTGHYDFNNATQAFKYAAVDFLVKPFSAKELQAAVVKVAKQKEPIQSYEQLSLLIDFLNSPQKNSERIAITLIGGKIQMIELSDILYLEAKASMTNFWLASTTHAVVANKNLGQYVDILHNDARFFSISNSLCINLDYLQTYDHGEQTVKLKECTQALYASRQGGQRLRQYLNTQNTITSSKIEPLKSFFRGLFGK